MKISLIAISIIIALNACTLLYNSQQRYVYHNTIHQISQLAKPLKSITSPSSISQTNKQTPCCNCFTCDQQLRYGAVAFMFAAAILLFTEDAIWPAFIAQLFWIVFESYLCTDRSLGNLRNFAIQLLILYVIGTNIKCCGCGNNSSKDSSKTQIINKPSLLTSNSTSTLNHASSQQSNISQPTPIKSEDNSSKNKTNAKAKKN